MQSTTTRIIRGVLSGGGLTLTTALVNLVLVRLIIGYLPMEIAGIWFLFLSIGAYIAYFDLGVSPTVSREIGFLLGSREASQEEKDRGIADIIATCLRMFEVLAASVLVMGLALGWSFISRVAEDAHHLEVGIAWVIFCIGASLNILGGAAFAALYGIGDVATERIIRSVMLMLGLVLSAAALYAGLGIVGLSAAWVIQNILARLVGWVVLFRNNPSLRAVKGRPAMAVFRKIAAPSIKWAAIGLGALLILQTDNPIIAVLLGTSFIPPYEAAVKVVWALMLLSLHISTSSTPFISKAYAAGDMDDIRLILSRSLRLALAIMLVISVYFAFFGQRVFELWLGEGNFIGYRVLWLLLLVLVLEAHHVIHATAVMATGHVIFLWAALLAGVMKIALSVYLVPRVGIYGAVLGTLVAQLLTNNWYAPYCSLRIFSISAGDYARTVMWPLAVLLALSAGASAAAGSIMGNMQGLPFVMATSAFVGLIGAACTYALVLTPRERRGLMDRARNWGGVHGRKHL